jgi:hypothetical protein
MEINEQAKEWLSQHANELDSEELLSEEEKMEMAETDGTWPIPKEVKNMGVFSDICTQSGFNNIIGNSANWSEILSRENLLNQWIIPHAVILFGKHWFDRVKWKKTIHRGIPFPLFTDEDKKSGIKLEYTSTGKAIIAKIISKVSYALNIYLQGKWYEKTKTIKQPGGYIIDSVKNDLVRDVGSILGFKLKVVLACPYCMSTRSKHDKKTPLIEHGSRGYSCNKCKELCINLNFQLQNEKDEAKIKKIVDKLKKIKIFEKFVGITCVCPSDNCNGHFVPLSSIDLNASAWNSVNLSDFKSRISVMRSSSRKSFVPKNTYSFVNPPSELKNMPLICPYCGTKFSPASALKMKSGFKNQSGKLTGLPAISIWKNKSEMILDKNVFNNSDTTNVSFKNNIPDRVVSLDSHIIAKQKIHFLTGEIGIHMAKINKNSISGLTSWYFFKAAINWIENFWRDAAEYFFGWKVCERVMTDKEMKLYPGQTKKKVTSVVRGDEIAIHQSFFHTWMKTLNDNINDFAKFGIRELGDFKWFCHTPKFSSGPKSVFLSKVDEKKRILNNTNIINVKTQRFSPRIGVVLSIYKIEDNITNFNYNHIKEMKFSEWQLIRMLPESSLEPGDNVRVEALMMSGHPTHAPFLRLMRLRVNVLGPIINKILEEEKSGERDIPFWEKWIENVKYANELNA